MRYISNGDFVFPFDSHLYWLKQIYMWSYQTGAANPDGVIRMPGRLLDVLVFAVFGNLAGSYFYLASSIVIAYISFFYFSRKFLDIASWHVCAVGALFFACNPIFLGNISKIGLVLAAAMLPATLAVVQQAFARRQFHFFLVWILLLNISLIHPFTFTVNFVVSGVYFLYEAWCSRIFVRKHVVKFAIIGLAALLLNAYFIFPMLDLGSVNKSVLSSDITNVPINYASFVEISNTGDIFTGLSLSKNVLKDYDFYSTSYTNIYFLGAFLFYVILLGIYLRVEQRMSDIDKKRFVILLAAFLALVLLAAVKLFYIDRLITLLITLPGGWMFRSPLKWQLYIPFALFSMLTIALAHVKRYNHRFLIFVSLGITFVLMNAFISFDIFQKLLTPRTVTNFSYLQQLDLNQKSILVVGGDTCFTYAENNPTVMTELNQVLTSKYAQVKQIDSGDVDMVNLDDYDYILGCQSTMKTYLARGYNFNLTHIFANDAFQLYANKFPQPYIHSAGTIFALDHLRQTSDKYNFVRNELHKPFESVYAPDENSLPVQGLQNVFDNLSGKNFQHNTITNTLNPLSSGSQKLYIRGQDHTLYYAVTGKSNNLLSLTTTQKNNYKVLPTVNGTQVLPVVMQSTKPLTLNYSNSAYRYFNMIQNPSFEKGPWQKNVSDCYAYDNEPSISMQITNDSTNGKRSIQLQAKNHIACTGPDSIEVKSGQHYLLSFDYKSIGGRYAGYFIGFNNISDNFIFNHLPDTYGHWQNFSEDILVPANTHSMQIHVYAFPEGDGVTVGTARYDNFFLTETPDLQSSFYLVSEPPKLVPPDRIMYTRINPTKTDVHVHGARTAFYLDTNESYSPRWQLRATKTGTKSLLPHSGGITVTEQNHLDINGSNNGWFVNTVQICQSSTSCTKNADGSYDMYLTMEYAPQRYFYVGVIISTFTAFCVAIYFVFAARRDHKHRRYWRWRR